MTPTQQYVLTFVEQHGPTTVRKLADINCWDEPRAGKLLRELEEQGALQSTLNPQRRGRPIKVYTRTPPQ